MTTYAVKATLQAMADAKGSMLTADEVIAAARDPNSVLHDQFDWDTEKAAEEHWRHVARRLIKVVEFEVKTKQLTVRIPMFVRNPYMPAKRQGYISVGKLRSDKDAAREVVVAEFARAAAALERAQNLAAFFGLENEVGELRGQIIDLGDRAAGNA